jgi:hypothetical protein
VQVRHPESPQPTVCRVGKESRVGGGSDVRPYAHGWLTVALLRDLYSRRVTCRTAQPRQSVHLSCARATCASPKEGMWQLGDSLAPGLRRAQSRRVRPLTKASLDGSSLTKTRGIPHGEGEVR